MGSAYDATMLDIDAYLDRIGMTARPTIDLAGLTQLQRGHMSHVPFENLDVFDRVPVTTGLEHSIPKIVEHSRGGWCFEVNGAFSALLDALGFDVSLLGAAVLLDGPSVVIDHATIEVNLDNTAYLVDVGFGDSFATPLEINRAGPQDGHVGTFEFIPSSQGLTLTRHDGSGVPEPQYRFKRTVRTIDEFATASDTLWTDTSLHWSQKPFATRLVDGGPSRITLLKDRLKRTTPDGESEVPVAIGDWNAVLRDNFGIERPSGSR